MSGSRKVKGQGAGQELLRQQTVLARFGELALRSEDLNEILTEACHLVGDALGTDLSKVIELEKDGETLLVRAGVGWKPGVVGQVRLKADEASSEGHALKTGKPVISPDISKEKRFHYPAFLIDNGVKALVNVPIIGAGGRQSFGILQVDSRTPRHFSESDVGFLGSYANLLAAAVERLRVMGDLRESMDRQQAALGTGLIGFFDWDVRAGTVTADQRFAGFYGLDQTAAAAGIPLSTLFESIHPEDRPAVETNVAAALTSLADYTKEFRLIHPNGELKWLLVRGHCYEREGEGPLRYTGTVVDVTASKLAEAALRRSNEALETRVAERTRELTAANRQLRAEMAKRERIQEALRFAHRLETLVEHLPIGAALVGPFGQVILANPEFRRLLPRLAIPLMDSEADDEWIGLQPDQTLIEPEDYPAARALRGEVVLNSEFLHRHSVTGERWRRISGIPVRGEDERVVAALVVIVDIDEEKRTAERQVLLTREVDHRAKNMLAVVQAALRLTRADDVASFVDIIEGRVQALARAQSLLATDRWSGADLHRLLQGELAAFLSRNDSGPRVELRGPRLTLPAGAAQPFSMALHELATNATKYGALSSAAGHLSVEWQVLRVPNDVLRLRWTETGGPLLEGPPAREGFGSRVLDRTVRHQLGGSASRTWNSTGLVCDIEMPLGRSKWMNGADVKDAFAVGLGATKKEQ